MRIYRLMAVKYNAFVVEAIEFGTGQGQQGSTQCQILRASPLLLRP